MPARPLRIWTDTDDQVIRDGYATGVPVRKLAEQLGRDIGAISRRAAHLGARSEARAQVAAANRAKMLDSKAKRLTLEAGLLDDAIALRQQLFAPTTVYNIGGRDNTYTEHTLPTAPAETQLKLMQAIGAAVDRSLKLAVHDSGVGTDDAKSLLSSLGKALGVNDQAPAS